MMATKTYAGKTVEVTDDGYLVDPGTWSPEIATELAREEGFSTLSEKQMAILLFLRERHLKGETLTIRSINKSGVADLKEFYQLFPGAALKKATRIAGVPKPASCV